MKKNNELSTEELQHEIAVTDEWLDLNGYDHYLADRVAVLQEELRGR